jgi:hypothetical protein
MITYYVNVHDSEDGSDETCSAGGTLEECIGNVDWLIRHRIDVADDLKFKSMTVELADDYGRVLTYTIVEH